MRVEVLGQVRVTVGDAEVSLAPQTRRLIGVLVAAAGGAVSADRIAEYVADGHAEGSSVRTAVSRARKVLGDRLSFGDGGYRLTLTDDELDAARFDQLVGRFRSLPEEARAGVLESALELWRGRAFGDLAEEEWAASIATRLDLARATATEDLASTMLATGRAVDAVEILERHVAEHPYHERPVALLMRSLDASGRRADAIRAYQRFRTTLRDDTGLDPSNELLALEAELLMDEPGPVGAPPLPRGTVTFLFTDIEGSTQRWAADEDGMAAALAVHDATIRASVEAHGGIVFKHTGDGVCAVFSSATEAMAAAIQAQTSLDLPVRMGLHTGEAELRDGDYFGPTLNRVARIMDAGHGGQILVSSATAGLVDGADLVDLGEHRLKGLSAPERILQFGDGRFPTLRVASARKGNLPIDLSEFVGRPKELADVANRVTDHRLVTLIGVGGTGKTRLAIETAGSMAPTFPDGCWLVELSRVLVPEAVPFSIATGIGVEPPERGDVLEAVIDRLRHQRAMLIIDNCEHVLDAAADAVERIAAECPNVTILATSREPLMVVGEHLVPVPSLSPDAALELFVARAGSESGGLDLDEQQTAAAAEVCERLDRLPLAIELAASRLRTMTPVEILERLNERFRLLVGGRRSRMERHQTMRGTVDWSYDLCTDAERQVFDRVSVFMSLFDIDAGRRVGCVPGWSETDVDDALASLVDRSLVQRSVAEDGTTRFSLLETMRAYGRERLVDTGRSDEVRDVHADYISEVLSALALRSLGPDERAVQRRIRSLAPDALVAIDWFVERLDWSRAVGIAWCYEQAAAGVFHAMVDRIASAARAADADTSAMDPFDSMLLDILPLGGSVYGDPRRAAEDRRRALELFEGGYSPARMIGWSPIALVEWRFDEASYDVVRRFVDQFADAPAIVRFTVLGDFHLALMYSRWLKRAIELRPEIERLAAELDSDTARRRCAAIQSLECEDAGDFVSALRHAERAVLGVERPAAQDALAAMRLVRLRALAGESLSGDDLRRPFEWCRSEALRLQVSGSLCSAAIAVDLVGRPGLADRMILQVLPVESRPTFVELYAPGSRMSPRLLDLLRSDEQPDELLDDVIADVYRLADELDRVEGSARAV